jgi:hypothetical protein
MKSLLKLMLCGFIFCFLCSNAIAATMNGNAPYVNSITISGFGIYNAGGGPGTLVDDLNTTISSAFANAELNANNDLAKYHDQKDLAKGFGNANAYAAQAGTLQGYQDYDIFAVTTGIMVGAQLPSSDKDYYDDLDKKIKDKGDLYAGVGMGVSLINFGLNAGFIYPGLFLNAKFGYFSNSSLVDNLSVKTTLVGIGANYSWIKTTSLLAGFFKWRGISFGTGFLYNRNKVDYKIDLDPISQSITPINTAAAPYNLPGGPTIAGNIIIDPSIDLGIKTNTYTVPFDVTTSVRLLWFLNLNLGLGIDFTYGSTDIIVKSHGSVRTDIPNPPNPNISMDVTPGTVTVDGSTKDKKPSWVRERITTGVGFNIAAVKIDVPVIIYPFDSAFAVGLTAGIVW